MKIKKNLYDRGNMAGEAMLRRLLKSRMERRSLRYFRARTHYPYRYEKQAATLIKKVLQKVTGIVLLRLKDIKSRHNDSEWDILLLTISNLAVDNPSFEEEQIGLGISFEKKVIVISELVKEFATNDLEQILIKLFGEKYYGSDLWWQTVQRQWVNEFNKRVRRAIGGYKDQVRTAIYEGIQNNRTFASIVKNIESISENIGQKRAAVLARDLVGALNGIVEKNLQLSIGIHLYIWQTMGDERVRGNPQGIYPRAIPSHWIMDGKVFDWNNDLVYSLDGGRTWKPRTPEMPMVGPGIEYNCRCLGQPFFDPIIKDIDKEIKREKRYE